MDTRGQLIAAILPIFLIVACGFAARRVRWLTREADASLLSVVFNLLYPCFIFSHILGNPALQTPGNLAWPPVAGFFSIVIGFALALAAGPRLGIGGDREIRTFSYATGVYNFGYFAIPVVIALFDRKTLGVLLVHNIGVEVAIWVVGVGLILTGGKTGQRPAWRRVFNPVVISIVLAVSLNIAGVAPHIPPFVTAALDQLGLCAIPLGVLLIGATLADLARGTRVRDRLPAALAGSAIRVLILPPLMIALAKVLPVSPELKAVMVVQAAMPCGVTPIVMARHYEGSPETALAVVLPSTIISLVSIPLWIGFGLNWVGL